MKVSSGLGITFLYPHAGDTSPFVFKGSYSKRNASNASSRHRLCASAKVDRFVGTWVPISPYGLRRCAQPLLSARGLCRRCQSEAGLGRGSLTMDWPSESLCISITHS
eukprot:4821931-Pleurochrysis_carterae.AAC.3